MKWCRFHAADGDSIRFGIVEGDQIVEVRGSPFAEYEKTAQKHLLSSTRLAVPAMPYNFYAMGANFGSISIGRTSASTSRSASQRRPTSVTALPAR